MVVMRRRGRTAHLGEEDAKEERQNEDDDGDHKEDENQEHVKVEPALQLLLRRAIGFRRVGPCRRVVESNTSNNDRSMTKLQVTCYKYGRADTRRFVVLTARQ